jgi:hypothetical protein
MVTVSATLAHEASAIRVLEETATGPDRVVITVAAKDDPVFGSKHPLTRSGDGWRISSHQGMAP